MTGVASDPFLICIFGARICDFLCARWIVVSRFSFSNCSHSAAISRSFAGDIPEKVMRVKDEAV